MENRKPSIVYIKSNSEKFITAVNSSDYLDDITGWIEIDSGFGIRYSDAYGNYFEKPILTERNVWQYKLVDGQPVECTAEEIAAQEALKPVPTPSLENRVEVLESTTDDMILLMADLIGGE